MSVLKLGLMGFGSIAQLVHLPILTHLSGVEIAALAEIDPDRQEKARRYVPKAIIFDDYKKLLQMQEVEAVVICLPNALHAEAAIAALRQGKHVYLEKPIAISLDEARNVLKVWNETNLNGMIGFNFRYHPIYQSAKQYIQSERLGQLVYVHSIFSTVSQSQPEWKQNRKTGGGALLDLASHHIDLIHFLFDQEIQEVSAQMRSFRSEDDHALLQMRLANGLLIQSFFSIKTFEKDSFEIYGQTGKLALNRHHSLCMDVNDPSLPFILFKLKQGFQKFTQLPDYFIKFLVPNYEPSFKAALAHFISTIHKKQPPTPDFLDGYRSLLVIQGAEESARSGRIVSLRNLMNENFTTKPSGGNRTGLS